MRTSSSAPQGVLVGGVCKTTTFTPPPPVESVEKYWVPVGAPAATATAAATTAATAATLTHRDDVERAIKTSEGEEGREEEAEDQRVRFLFLFLFLFFVC